VSDKNIFRAIFLFAVILILGDIPWKRRVPFRIVGDVDANFVPAIRARARARNKEVRASVLPRFGIFVSERRIVFIAHFAFAAFLFSFVPAVFLRSFYTKVTTIRIFAICMRHGSTVNVGRRELS